MNTKKAVLIIVIILLIDQLSKIYIKTHFELRESINVFNLEWFKITFVENPGMAWGKKLSDFFPITEPTAKVFLTCFRLIAITAILYWLRDCIKKQAPKLLIIAISLIFAGAFGNVLDSLFYGYLFDSGMTYNEHIDSWMYYDGVSKLNFEGYCNVMQGCVVDMLQFPMFTWTWPDWMPAVGGEKFTFFEPIFNVADMAISTGIGILLVFNKRVFPKSKA